MIDPVLFGLFLVTTIGMVASPGPIVSLIVAETVAHGAKYGIIAALAAASTASLYLLVYLLGFSALLSQHAALLEIIQVVGALYLIWMAWGLLRDHSNSGSEDGAPMLRSKRKAWVKALFVSGTSPKVVLFFAAFFPQFLSSDIPHEPQLVIMAISFLAVSMALDLCWIALASGARKWLGGSALGRWLNKLTAGVMGITGLGVLVSAAYSRA